MTGDKLLKLHGHTGQVTTAQSLHISGVTQQKCISGTAHSASQCHSTNFSALRTVGQNDYGADFNANVPGMGFFGSLLSLLWKSNCAPQIILTTITSILTTITSTQKTCQDMPKFKQSETKQMFVLALPTYCVCHG